MHESVEPRIRVTRSAVLGNWVARIERSKDGATPATGLPPCSGFGQTPEDALAALLATWPTHLGIQLAHEDADWPGP